MIANVHVKGIESGNAIFSGRIFIVNIEDAKRVEGEILAALTKLKNIEGIFEVEVSPITANFSIDEFVTEAVKIFVQ